MRLLAKGMVEAGTDVHVLALDPVKASSEGAGEGGVFEHEGVRYESAARFAFGTRESGLQRFLRTPGIVSRSRQRLNALLDRGGFDAVLLYIRSYTKARPLVSIARQYGVPVFMHLVEWPTPNVFKLGGANPLLWDHRAGSLLLVNRCAGAVVITRYLQNKLETSGKPTLLVPSVADFHEDGQTPPRYRPSGPDDPFVLFFSGAMKETDDVFTMLEAFRRAVARGSHVALKVVGTDCRSGKARVFRARVEQDASIRERVRFVGRVSDQQYRGELQAADATLFPRSLEPRSLGAFPMRIPEYLSAGKPLITTAVPDVPAYLNDKEHACVARPGDPEDLAARISWLADNRNEAVTIAANGFAQGRRCFDYREQSRRMLAFFQHVSGHTAH